jgi:hypothetical protein
VDPKISIIPVRIINFVTRTVIGTIWGQLLHVAKQVQNKERMHHMNAIQSQPELYEFIEQRVQQLLLNSVRDITKGAELHDQSTQRKDDGDLNEENFKYVSYLQS